VWGIVHGFSGINALEELDGPNIHRLSNGLTIGVDLHYTFEDLGLWFEAVHVSDPLTIFLCKSDPSNSEPAQHL